MFTFALPAIGGVAELAASLLTVILWGVALGLAIAWRYTIGAALEWLANVFDAVSVLHIRPLHPFAEGLRGIDYAITKGLDKVITGAEHATVWLFRHGLRLIVWTATEIWALSRDTFRALEHFDKVWLPRAIHHALQATGAFAVRLAHAVARNERRFWHDVTTLAHRLTQAIVHRLHVVESAIAHTLPRVGRLEHDVARQKAELKRIAELITLAGFSAFMWRWLKGNGLRWLRCGSVGRIGSQIGCGGFKLLEDLLFGVIDVLLIADLCRITKTLIDVAESSIVQDALRGFIDGIEHLLLCQNVTRPQVWHVHAAALPPAQTWSALPPVG